MAKENWSGEKLIITEHISYANKLTVFFWTCALITANSMCIHTMIEWLMGDAKDQPEVQIFCTKFKCLVLKSISVIS